MPNAPTFVDLRVDAAPTDIRCDVAKAEYENLKFWRNMFTALVWFLSAATVVFLIIMLAFLVWTLRHWQSSDTIDQAIQVVATLGSAAGALVTGRAAMVVNNAKKAQDDLLAAAQRTVNRVCAGQPPAP